MKATAQQDLTVYMRLGDGSDISPTEEVIKNGEVFEITGDADYLHISEIHENHIFYALPVEPGSTLRKYVKESDLRRKVK